MIALVVLTAKYNNSPMPSNRNRFHAMHRKISNNVSMNTNPRLTQEIILQEDPPLYDQIAHYKSVIIPTFRNERNNVTEKGTIL